MLVLQALGVMIYLSDRSLALPIPIQSSCLLLKSASFIQGKGIWGMLNNKPPQEANRGTKSDFWSLNFTSCLVPLADGLERKAYFPKVTSYPLLNAKPPVLSGKTTCQVMVKPRRLGALGMGRVQDQGWVLLGVNRPARSQLRLRST